mgnify:CR=1 FL=1
MPIERYVDWFIPIIFSIAIVVQTLIVVGVVRSGT